MVYFCFGTVQHLCYLLEFHVGMLLYDLFYKIFYPWPKKAHYPSLCAEWVSACEDESIYNAMVWFGMFKYFLSSKVTVCWSYFLCNFSE